MDLATPLSLGGGRYLQGISVGCDPDSRTVRDCPVCGGRLTDDEFHLVATVRDRARGGGGSRRALWYLCDEDCLHGWLRTFPGT